MPPLPKPRSGHTQTGSVLCGGTRYAGTTCLTFFSGGEDWVKTHNLTQNRLSHSAWASPRGIMLMGSLWSKKTTEILTDDGDSTPSFTLDDKTT